MGQIDPAHKSAFWNPFANMATLAGNAITIVRGEGSTVYDADGRAYLDALASLWYCNVGYGRTELAEAAAAQMREIAGFQTFEYFTNPPAEALCRRVADLAPMPDAKVFLTPAAARTRSTPPASSPGRTGGQSASQNARSSSPGRMPTTG